VSCRRLLPAFLAVVKTLALLRHRQRKSEEQGGVKLLLADLQDYEDARRLFQPLLERALAEIDPKSVELLKTIREHAKEGEPFTRADIARWSGIGDRRRIAERITPLVDVQVRKLDDDGPRGSHRYVLAEDMTHGEVTNPTLPTREEVEASWQSPKASEGSEGR
jgi:hypothetical protein